MSGISFRALLLLSLFTASLAAPNSRTSPVRIFMHMSAHMPMRADRSNGPFHLHVFH